MYIFPTIIPYHAVFNLQPTSIYIYDTYLSKSKDVVLKTISHKSENHPYEYSSKSLSLY